MKTKHRSKTEKPTGRSANSGKARDYVGSQEANRRAAAILEVLAGLLTPNQASAELGVSQPSYYAIETKALRGLVAGCEPRKKGPMKRPEAVITELEKEITALKRDVTRLQALVRLSRQAVSLKPKPRASEKSRKTPTSTRRRRRKPTVRALKAVETLRQRKDGPDAAPVFNQEDKHASARTTHSGNRTDGLSTGIG